MSVGLLLLGVACGSDEHGADKGPCGNLEDAGTQDGGAADAGSGVVMIHIDAVVCDDITMTIVAPRAFDLGTPTQISGTASNAAGDHFSVLWSASSGHFGDRRQPQTTFTCTEAGLQTVTLLVANLAECSNAVAAAVQCEGSPSD